MSNARFNHLALACSLMLYLCGLSYAADLQWYNETDPQTGMVIVSTPYPSDWQNTGQSWQGPGNTKMAFYEGGTQDGYADIDELISTKVKALVEDSGNRILNIKNYPRLAQINREDQARYWSVGAIQIDTAVRGIEFEDDNGIKGLLLFNVTNLSGEYTSMFRHFSQVLESEADYFEQSKAALLYALTNKQVNPQYIAMVNQREQQKAASSNAQFQANQRLKQQQFDSYMNTQRSNSDALDSSMDSWRRRQGMIDSGHEQTVDGIYGQTQVIQPNTGETWKVQDGYNNYFMNNDGEYIPTDDYFYNPNMDPYYNNQEWQQVYPGAYGGQ